MRRFAQVAALEALAVAAPATETAEVELVQP